MPSIKSMLQNPPKKFAEFIGGFMVIELYLIKV
jgi:hypothetical protein